MFGKAGSTIPSQTDGDDGDMNAMASYLVLEVVQDARGRARGA